MDMLAVENAVVYGVSQGGMIAQEIALRRPELVRKLILCSTASYIPEKAGSILSKWAELAEKYDIPGLMQAFAENVYSAGYCEKYRDAFTEYGRNPRGFRSRLTGWQEVILMRLELDGDI